MDPARARPLPPISLPNPLLMSDFAPRGVRRGEGLRDWGSRGVSSTWRPGPPLPSRFAGDPCSPRIATGPWKTTVPKRGYSQASATSRISVKLFAGFSNKIVRLIQYYFLITRVQPRGGVPVPA